MLILSRLNRMPRRNEMKVGTKSVLFGIHQFVLHPFFVTIAWVKVYGSLPTLREFVCIVCHDIGYYGKPNMDGPEGITHPELSATIIRKILGECPDEVDMVLFHSRSYARFHGREVSALCLPDKLSILLYPYWLYLLLGNLSGEIYEYKSCMKLNNLSNTDWLTEVRNRTFTWADRTTTGLINERINKSFSPLVEESATNPGN